MISLHFGKFESLVIAQANLYLFSLVLISTIPDQCFNKMLDSNIIHAVYDGFRSLLNSKTVYSTLLIQRNSSIKVHSQVSFLLNLYLIVHGIFCFQIRFQGRFESSYQMRRSVLVCQTLSSKFCFWQFESAIDPNFFSQ